MIVRIASFTLGPDTRKVAEELADEVNGILRSCRGLRSATFFGDFEKGEYGSCTVWDTIEDAEDAGKKIMPISQQRVGSMLKAPPNVRTLEHYSPKV